MSEPTSLRPQGLSSCEPGQAGYDVKIRLGCRRLANWYYFRHRYPLINALRQAFVRLLQLDRFDAVAHSALEAT